MQVFRKGVIAMLWTERGSMMEDPYVLQVRNAVKPILTQRINTTNAKYEKIDWKVHGKNILSKITPRYRPSIQNLMWRENPSTKKLARDRKLENNRFPLCGDIGLSENYSGCVQLRSLE